MLFFLTPKLGDCILVVSRIRVSTIDALFSLYGLTSVGMIGTQKLQ